MRSWWPWPWSCPWPWMVALWLAFPVAARAQQPTPAEQQQLEKALGADAAARAAGSTSSIADPGQAAAANATLPQPPTAGAGASFGRLFQSLNPDMSVIVDAAGGYYDSPLRLSGDDPGGSGVTVQELELAFSATVDPYFRADVYLTVPNLQGLEVEEAYLTTTSLPGALQLRAGSMRAAFGRQNTQHLHQQHFTRRPSLNALFLGPDGLRAPGVELSWLAPLPFYLLVTGEALSVSSDAKADDPLATFGGGKPYQLTYLANVRTFASLTDEVSALLGLSYATGLTAGTAMPGHNSHLFGADLYVKWKPGNVAETYMSLAWTTEFVLRDVPVLHDQLEGALYSQLVWQAARRWFVGVRGEVNGLPSGPAVPRDYVGAASLTWQLSEFALVRAYGEVRYLDPQRATTYAAFFQLEASIGAHGAHPY